jgi:hypothetical protein
MSDRGFLFLFSVFMILAGLASAAWLIATGQALTMDGLFLILTCLLVSLCFLLYVVFLVKRVRESLEAKQVKPARSAAPAAQGKTLVAAEKTAES